MMDKIKKFFLDPVARFTFLAGLGLTRWVPDQAFIKKEYKLHMGKPLNLLNPQTFNEKLQWLKLYNRNPIYTTMVDKAEAKKYVADIIGEEYIIPTLGVWDRFDDIDFESLPNQFVMKCTHDSGGLVICKDKSKLDIPAAKKKINQFLKRKYFYIHREWPYKNVKPRIIVETYLEDRDCSGNPSAIKDYKLYCFNGTPKYLYVAEGLENHATAKISFLNLDWTMAAFKRKDYAPLTSLPEKPLHLDQMISCAEKLSQGLKFIRVDFYEVRGQVYFGELTFTPCAGMMPFDPEEWDLKLGEDLQI